MKEHFPKIEDNYKGNNNILYAEIPINENQSLQICIQKKENLIHIRGYGTLLQKSINEWTFTPHEPKIQGS